MIDIIHRVGIKAPLPAVYTALSTIDGLAGWWTRETTGDSKPGGNIDFHFSAPSGEPIGGLTMSVTALEHDKEVHWRCTAGPQEWIGTDVVFKLAQDGEFVIVHFTHRNWREAVEFTEHCSTKWAVFMLSLKALAETGEGQPAPVDVKIGNWH